MNLGASRILDPVTRDAVLAALRGGEWPRAIRLYRLSTGASLSDAKRAVDAIAMQNGIVTPLKTSAMRFPFTTVVLLLVLIAVAVAIATRGH